MNARGCRVLILTAGYGEGHNAAARALLAAFEEAGGAGTARVVDLIAAAYPRLNAATRRAYVGAINRLPRLWGRIYRLLDDWDSLPRRLGLLRDLDRGMQALMASDRPAVVCSTFPIYGYLVERWASAGRPRPPLYTVVTDSISVNSLWWRSPSTGYFVPNEDTAEVLLAAGLEPARVLPQGFPVALTFEDQAKRLSPPELGPGSPPRILHIVHSGTRHAEATARLLLSEPGWEVTCAVGRDERLKGRLSELAAGCGGRARVLGWTDQIPRLLLTHHAVVSKAGGATTQEAVAARCPMIVSQVVPGQEEGNYELLRRHGVGTLAETPQAVRDALRGAFADGGALLRRWRSGLDPISKPGAARSIAAYVLSQIAPFHVQSVR